MFTDIYSAQFHFKKIKKKKKGFQGSSLKFLTGIKEQS